MDFLFNADKETPKRIRCNLVQFGKRLRNPDSPEKLDNELLKLKRAMEADLTRVICRTERNWYVLDQKKGVDDEAIDKWSNAGKGELEEFFRPHRALSTSARMGQVTEFWKSAPSLLTFMDAQYHVFRALRERKLKVPRSLLTPPSQVKRSPTGITESPGLIDLALGLDDAVSETLGRSHVQAIIATIISGLLAPRKALVFSGWRFVPKAVAIVTSRSRPAGSVVTRRNLPTDSIHEKSSPPCIRSVLPFAISR